MIFLMHPFASMTTTVQLKDPEFQDVQAEDIRVDVKTTMSGGLRTRRFTPATTRLKYKFINVTRKKAIELYNFLIASQGQEIRLLDFNGISWRGHILTEPTSFTTTGRGLGSNEPRREAVSLDLEFEGVPLG